MFSVLTFNAVHYFACCFFDSLNIMEHNKIPLSYLAASNKEHITELVLIHFNALLM
jgi:hypothetical protein